MAGGHIGSPQFLGFLPKDMKLHRRIAENAGNGGDPPAVSLHKGCNDLFLQLLPYIHRAKGDPQFQSGLVSFFHPSVAGVQINTCDRMTFFQQQTGTQCGIHAAGQPQYHFFQFVPLFSMF